VKFDCSDPTEFERGLESALVAIQSGKLVVTPTDTVYGLAADAFSPAAVQNLLSAKGRGRNMPPPVLVAHTETLDALATDVPAWLRTMLGELWPGALTVILRQQPSLTWDLGETLGTVAVRMPADERALALIRKTGPLAVSSANTTGDPAAQSVEQAQEMLGGRVAVYLDGGPTSSGVPSTILDATGPTARVVRMGAIDLQTLHKFNNTIESV
jgi:L-threonylcarbamoyladenylate synthase